MQLSFETGKETQKKYNRHKKQTCFKQKNGCTKKSLAKKSQASFQVLRGTMQSMVALRDFMLLLLLFIFIFMVLGIQLFGGNPYYTPANTASWRKGFASFYESFYTVSHAAQRVLVHSESFNTVSHAAQQVILYIESFYTASHSAQQIILHHSTAMHEALSSDFMMWPDTAIMVMLLSDGNTFREYCPWRQFRVPHRYNHATQPLAKHLDPNTGEAMSQQHLWCCCSLMATLSGSVALGQ